MPVIRILSVLLLLAALVQGQTTHRLRILGNDKAEEGELISLDGKNVVFKTAEGTVTKPLSQVLQIELNAAPALSGVSFMQVELTDGSVLNCKAEDWVFQGKKLQLTVLPDVKVEVPISALSFILKDAHEAKIRDNADWKGILKSRRNHDMLVRWFQGRLNGLNGTFTDGKDSSINFILEGRDSAVAIDLKNPAVQGCVFVNRPDANAPLPVCKLHDTSHNLLMVAKLELKEGGEFAVTTVSGVSLRYKRDLVARLDCSSDKLTYLSDLTAQVLEEPSEAFFFPPRHCRDKNCDGKQLRIGGIRFDKGVFVPAPTRLLYRLGGEYNHFLAQVGVDDHVGGRPNVRLIIETDGKEIFNAEFQRSAKPREVRLNVKDAHELRISVVPINPVDLSGNHLTLADAKISK